MLACVVINFRIDQFDCPEKYYNKCFFNTFSGANTVLRVIVEHMVYPVTLDVIFQIFSRVGKVLKIVTFTKNNTFQALIQVNVN